MTQPEPLDEAMAYGLALFGDGEATRQMVALVAEVATLRAKVERVEALAEKWDALTKGQSPRTAAIRAALADPAGGS